VCCSVFVLVSAIILRNGAVGRHLITVVYLSCSGSQDMDYVMDVK
jgi:hypothetical protein